MGRGQWSKYSHSRLERIRRKAVGKIDNYLSSETRAIGVVEKEMDNVLKNTLNTDTYANTMRNLCKRGIAPSMASSAEEVVANAQGKKLTPYERGLVRKIANNQENMYKVAKLDNRIASIEKTTKQNIAKQEKIIAKVDKAIKTRMEKGVFSLEPTNKVGGTNNVRKKYSNRRIPKEIKANQTSGLVVDWARGELAAGKISQGRFKALKLVLKQSDGGKLTEKEKAYIEKYRNDKTL